MQETLTLMRQVTEQLFSSGKYAGLFIGAILFLLFYRRNILRKELVSMAIILAILIGNPFLPYLCMNGWEELEGYGKLFGVLPVLVVTAYAYTLVVGRIKNPKKRLFLAGIGAAIILLCGSGAIFQSETGYSTNRYKIPQEALETIEAIEQYREENQLATIMLLASNEIMEYARSYSSNIQLLYGKDLWQGRILTQLQDGYEEEIYHIFGLMQSPKEFIAEIFNAANLYDCDVVVLPKEIEGQKVAELGYTIYETTDKYTIFVRE